LGRCGCPLRFRALARNCGLSVGRFTGIAGHQRSSWSDCRSWVVTCEDTLTSLVQIRNGTAAIAAERSRAVPPDRYGADSNDSISFSPVGAGMPSFARLANASGRKDGRTFARQVGAVRRPVHLRGAWRGVGRGRGAGDLRERPRRRASERSERASLAAPPERPLSPKSRPLPTHRHRCRSQLRGDQLEKKGDLLDPSFWAG
jgi:hypothetical protein